MVFSGKLSKLILDNIFLTKFLEKIKKLFLFICIFKWILEIFEKSICLEATFHIFFHHKYLCMYLMIPITLRQKNGKIGYNFLVFLKNKTVKLL